MPRSPIDAIVVGGGPNGLAAAITLAAAGKSVRLLEAERTIGGAARTQALTLPGYVHDVGSAIHPLALASPFFEQLDLGRYGLEWIQPELPVAHPLDDGTAALVHRSVDATADGLAADGKAWRSLMGPLVANWEALRGEILQPLLHLPKHPWLMAVFGLRALQPAAGLARREFSHPHARALFAGLAAHSLISLQAPASAAVALVLGAAAHAVGWPLPKGGSQRLSDALAQHLRALGGEIEAGRPVSDVRDLPAATATLLDISAWNAAEVAGAVLPRRYQQRLRNFRHGPAVFKIDYALSAPIPWTAAECLRAGTVHVGGSLEEIVLAEGQVADGKLPEKPFVLVSQPTLFDPTRAPAGKQIAWAYCRMPFGATADMTAALEQQIERFAPGFRDCILTRQITGPADLEKSNASLVGGDISGGSTDLWQLLARPILSPTPYRMPARGLYLCSSSTPPGTGVHGMCGHLAALAALRREFR